MRQASHHKFARLGVDFVGAVLGAFALLAGAIALLLPAVRAVGAPTVLGALGVSIVLALVNTAWVSAALPRAPRPLLLLLGATVGLAITGIAVWFSGVVGIHAARWPALLLPAALWFLPAARRPWRRSGERWSVGKALRRESGVMWGVGMAYATASSVLLEYFAPWADGAAQLEYYVDIPWHIALTAEGIGRAPEVYPWISDVPIGYSWLFFATLAGIAEPIGATAAQMVLAIGPTLLVLMTAPVIAFAARMATGSRWAGLLAPVFYTFARSPLFGPADTSDITPQWVLINRDATNLTVLALVVMLTALTARRTLPRRELLPLLGLLFVIAFASAGARGGAVAPMLGAAGLVWLFSLARPGRRAAATLAAAVVVVGSASATFAVTRSSGSFAVRPLTFLAPLEDGVTPLVPTFASLAVMTSMIAATVVAARRDARFGAVAVPYIGGVVAGVLGLALLGHPSFSQRYFFHGSWPLLVIGATAVLVVALRAAGRWSLAVFALCAVLCGVAVDPPSPLPAEVRLGVVLLAASVAALFFIARLGAVRWRAAGVLGLLVFVFAVQNWGLPRIEHGAAAVLTESSQRTVGPGLRAVYERLRTASDADDLVMTNKHCFEGATVVEGGCDARWFAAAAFSERRMLVEGYSYDYTWTSSGTDNREPYWDPALLAANDAFIATPELGLCERFARLDVEWVLADKREAWSPRLALFGEVLVDDPEALVIRLDPSCAAAATAP